MKKLIIGLVAVGAVLAVRPVVRRKAHKMREHCEQMAATCKEKMAKSGGGSEEAGMREHCQEMAEQHKFGTGGQETEVSEPAFAAVGDRGEALSTA